MKTVERLRFNVQNPQYALLDEKGDWGKPKSLGSARKITLDSNMSTKNVNGNGHAICTLVNDKGKTGTLTVNSIPDQYDIDMGRKIKTQNGMVDIMQQSIVRHCIYFEISELINGVERTVAKTWLYGVSTTRASESYDQTEEDITVAAFDIPLEIKGLPILKADGTVNRINGVEMYAWQTTVTPEAVNYDTFEDTVALPILDAPIQAPEEQSPAEPSEIATPIEQTSEVI